MKRKFLRSNFDTKSDYNSRAVVSDHFFGCRDADEDRYLF